MKSAEYFAPSTRTASIGGEKEVHLVVEAALRAAHLKFLEDTGIDVKQVMVNGPLKVLPWTTHAKRQRHLWRSERRCS